MAKSCFFIAICLSFLFGCSGGKIDEPQYVVGHVDSTHRTHWGKGYFKIHVYYSFTVKNKKVSSKHIHKLGRSYTSSYEKGDSILVAYDKNDLEKSKVLKITEKKRKVKL